MILEEFDEEKTAVLNPEHFIKKLDGMPKTCVGFFSKTAMNLFVEKYNAEIVGESNENTTDRFPVHSVNINGTKIAVAHLPVGAPACVVSMEVLIALGAKNILAVGCCGCLDKEMEVYSIIIPTSAIRDEGTSYHYAPASEETVLDTKMVKTLENVMKRNKLHYHKGKTWTTDAPYRETRKKVNERISKGAITVDMECSAMNVVCKFRGVKFGQIFYAADMLANEEYDPRILTKVENHDNKMKIINLALECALEIDKKF